MRYRADDTAVDNGPRWFNLTAADANIFIMMHVLTLPYLLSLQRIAAFKPIPPLTMSYNGDNQAKSQHCRYEFAGCTIPQLQDPDDMFTTKNSTRSKFIEQP